MKDVIMKCSKWKQMMCGCSDPTVQGLVKEGKKEEE
jgi:hypothetical protein